MKKTIIDSISSTGMLRLMIPLVAKGVAVLRYHSVQERPRDVANSIGIGITHSAQLFREQMELLSIKYVPVTMDDVLEFIQGGKMISSRAVAITFDDGFADNFEVAKPILDQYGIPATFYVTVSSLESTNPPWYIRLRHAFFSTSQKNWITNDGKVVSISDHQSRNNALVKACEYCATLAGRNQNIAVTEIEEALQVDPYMPNPGIMLTWEQVRRMRTSGHIIGSHTLSHPNMAFIEDENVLLDEMISSKKQIENQLGEPVTHFSYPSPMLEPHWSERTVNACRMAGYDTATTCTPGKVNKGDNPLALKRMWVPFTMEEFKWYLDNTLLGRTL